MVANGSNKVVVWEWLNDYFRWNPYPPHISKFFENNRNKNIPVYLREIDTEYSLYYIDFSTNKQVREINGCPTSTRDIRRSLYQPSSLPARGIQWEWEADNRRKWHHFDSEVAEFLERCHNQNHHGDIDLSEYPYGMPYKVCLDTMTQTRIGTGRARPIRREIISDHYPIDGETPVTAGSTSTTVSVKTEISNGVVRVESTSVSEKGGTMSSVITTSDKPGVASTVIVTNETLCKDSSSHSTKVVTTCGRNETNMKKEKQSPQKPPSADSRVHGVGNSNNSTPVVTPSSLIRDVINLDDDDDFTADSNRSYYRSPLYSSQAANSLAMSRNKHVNPSKNSNLNVARSCIKATEQAVNKNLGNVYIKKEVDDTCKSGSVGMPSVSASGSEVITDVPIMQVAEGRVRGNNDAAGDVSDTETNYCPIKIEREDNPTENVDFAINIKQESDRVIAGSSAVFNETDVNIENGPKTRFRRSRRPVVVAESAKKRRKSGENVIESQAVVKVEAHDVLTLVLGKVFKVKNNVAALNKKFKGQDVDVMLKEYTRVIESPRPDQTCSICRADLTEHSTYDTSNHASHVVSFIKCSHCYHSACFTQLYLASKSRGYVLCAECNEIYGEKVGVCPSGVMHIELLDHHLPGYQDCLTIQVMYDIKGGKQGHEHLNPGCRYTAVNFPRVGYFPNNEAGKKVLLMLVVAWKRRLTFTVGTSTTSGLQDTVTWNDIHHKTVSHASESAFGYPDYGYMDRVTSELEAHGVRETDIGSLSAADFA